MAVVAGDIFHVARAKPDQVHKQLAKLTLLHCRLHQLVRVCEDGDGEDCLAVRLGQPVQTAGMP